ncbi:MAG: tRNA (adenosine(37)-N6)-dimethylallyltransferase MiaA [Lachnospiraceae bacterium]|nr:tRNA (adenosine(37)-N6)-dimethylallyltransferase MiaA [Lachnospiraceae bacterium]
MNKVIVIAGPTAVGKSEIAVKLAKKIDGEIISADSMQVYRDMNIGSAKVTKEETGGIPHYLIDELSPFEEFNVSVFTEKASAYIDMINKKGKIPIVTGGTGFYIRALLYGNDFDESKGEDTDFRANLERTAKEQGPDVLYERLKAVDPASCEIIHKNNVKRVIRALEFYNETGTPISEHNQRQKENPPAYDFLFFVITDDRALLYERIDKRVDKMMAAGLVDEVKHLKDMGLTKENISMQGIGYKEILDFLDGNTTLDEAVYNVKINSRHYAKRQITWFKRDKDAVWIHRAQYPDTEEIVALMANMIKEKGFTNE